MIKVINLSNIEALSLYITKLKSQIYDYISLEELDKLYDTIKLIEKFDTIKFSQKFYNLKSVFK